MILDKKIFTVAIIIWFGCFSGTYIFFGLSIYPPLFMSLLGYLYIVLIYKKLPKYALFFLFIGFLYILLFLMSYLYHQEYIEMLTIEFRYILKAFFIPLGVSFFLLGFFKKYHLQKNEIAKSIVLVIILQAILVLFQLLDDTFRECFFSYLSLSGGWMNLVKMGHFRTVGLSGLSIYDTAIAYSLLFGITIYLINDKTKKYLVIWTFSFIVFFILILLSGRSGLVLFVNLTALILLNVNNKKSLYLLLLISVTIFSFTIGTYVDYEVLELFFRFAFEFFSNSNGSFESASTNDFLENHLLIPWNVNPIIGDGIWAQPSISRSIGYEYMTDSGYILSFISIGVTGVLLALIMTYKIISAYELVYFKQFKKNIINLILKVIISVLLFMIILKGPLFFSDKFMPVMIIVFMIHYYGSF